MGASYLTPRAQRLAKLLDHPEPLISLRREVQEELANGLFRETVLGDLEDLRSQLADAGEPKKEELIQSTINDLVGYCSPHWSMENLGTEELEDPEAE
jgi:hypothetical protein